jgi:hypothetical protein
VGAGAPVKPHEFTLHPWQYALRFALEIASLTALGVGARHIAGYGAIGWAAAIAAPLVAAVVWGVFAVPGDTRGPSIPVRVAGWVRVVIEAGVLGAGAAALAVTDHGPWFAAFVAALVVDHWAMRGRIRWLLRQR